MRIRYHLGNGPHYMHWQLKSLAGIYYFNPKECVLEISNCTLRNQRATADKIFYGAQKTVCAWIDFKSLWVFDPKEVDGSRIIFNPRKLPYWHNENGDNLDGEHFDKLILTEKGVLKWIP